MDFDASTLVYIVAIVIYFLYSTFFNKKVPEQRDEEVSAPENRPRKTASFDDLLKEIRREQGQLERDMEGQTMEEDYRDEETYEQPNKYGQPKQPVLEPAPKKYFTYEDPEQFPSADASSRKGQEKYQQYKKQPLVKLDDQVDIESDEKILGEVEDVAGEYRRKNKYASILKNPDTVRDAVVVSEILRRKHF